MFLRRNIVEPRTGERPAPRSVSAGLLLGWLASAVGFVAAWAWVFAPRRTVVHNGVEQILLLLPRAPWWVWALGVCVLPALAGLALRRRDGGADPRRVVARLGRWLTAWFIPVLPYGLLRAGGVTEDLGVLFWVNALEGLAIVAALAATAHALLVAGALRAPAWRPGWRLWLLFFVCAHGPAAWHIQPWAPAWHQHRALRGDEPDILLLVHSMAVDHDFNLYNNLANGDVDRFICPIERTYDTTLVLADDEYFAGRAVRRWNSGPPHSTPEYWHGRRYNMYRPGMGLIFAPGYRLGLALNEHQLYGVVLTLSLLLAFAMANIFLLALRVTGRPAASALAALTTGLGGPMVTYGAQVYPDPICAALLIYAVRKLYDFVCDRREGREPSWGASLGLGAAVCYMPWVHEKMLGLAVLLLATYLVVTPWRWRTILPILGLALLSELLQMRYYGVLYGHGFPVYVHAEPFQIGHLFEGDGLPGLLLDRYRGLVDLAPWVLAGFLGLLLWVRREPRFAWLPLVLVVAFLVSTGAFGWGLSGNTRYPVNIMPLLGVGLAVAWTRARRGAARAVVLGLCALAILQGVAGEMDLDLLFARQNRWLSVLFPFLRRVDGNVSWMTAWAWILLAGWFWAFLLRPMRWAGHLVGLLLAAAILWTSWMARPTLPQSVVWGVRPRLLSVLADPEGRPFEQRIALLRDAMSYYPELAAQVSELPSRIGARALAGKGRRPEADARDNFVHGAAREGTTNVLGQVLYEALPEGSYRAEFRVRRPGSRRSSGAAVFAVTQGHTRQPVNVVRVGLETLGADWSMVRVPFEFAQPQVSVGACVDVEGTGSVDVESVRFVYHVVSGRTL